VPDKSPSSLFNASLTLDSKSNRCYDCNRNFSSSLFFNSILRFQKVFTSLVNLDAIGKPFTVRPTRTLVETICSAYS
jgi:hypothetical protein